MNMASTQLVPTTVIPIFSWRESMSTTMKLLVASTSHVLFFLIWSLAQWTLSVPDHSDKSSDQTTLCLDRAEPETTGPRATTQRVLNSSILSLTLSVKRLKAVIACR